MLRRGECGGQREALLRGGKDYKTECRSRGCTQGSGAHGMWTHGGRDVGAGRRPMVVTLRSLTQCFYARDHSRPARSVARSHCARLLQLLLCAAWQGSRFTKLLRRLCALRKPLRRQLHVQMLCPGMYRCLCASALRRVRTTSTLHLHAHVHGHAYAGKLLWALPVMIARGAPQPNQRGERQERNGPLGPVREEST